ncbi:probable histone acetyltransferase [Fusarium fujikuroi]|nr:probable histone acetyltransferase [Fusarium fujikuroi]
MDSKQSLPCHLPTVANQSASEQLTITLGTIYPAEAQVLHFQPKDMTDKTAVPEKPAVMAERNGEVKFQVVYNDGGEESMGILESLKSIFQFQYPEMSKDYIERHVNDPKYRSIAIVRKSQETIGGITFRQLGTWNVAEVAFCAVSSKEQIKGYGAALMDHLKDYIKATSPVTHLLTYADNYHIGFIVKQGFKRATLDESVVRECRKGYRNVTLLQCSIDRGIAGRQHKL